MRCLTGMQPGESSRAIKGSVMEPIAYCRAEDLARKPAKVAASCLKVNRILVPINFSTTSLGAVRYAASLAEWFGASVCLLHVVPSDSFTQSLHHLGLFGSHDEVASMGARLLIKLACAEIAPDARGGTSLRVGKPAQEIVAAAESMGMNLIILSIDGDSGLKHPLSSGVAEGVVRQQPCPTLTLRRELLFPARIAHLPIWSNILVPVDLTEFSRRSVRWAAGLAEKLGAKITLRYAPGFFAETPIPKSPEQSLFQAREPKAIELQLAEWGNLGARGAVAVDLLPEMERPDAHVVGQMLRRAGSDLIVTGTPRYSWWHNVVHGGSAEQLRRVAPCPVLSVPQKDLERYADGISD
jgi:universal stress protein A